MPLQEIMEKTADKTKLGVPEKESFELPGSSGKLGGGGTIIAADNVV
jgi:hypothetical protein